jgi:hypothetical protein
MGLFLKVGTGLNWLRIMMGFRFHNMGEFLDQLKKLYNSDVPPCLLKLLIHSIFFFF